eukprot:GHRR01008970.1.p1 GENE.GHRR01008970.1~~GHRR01008970.1.p1  ORF type:complete len:188 (+),score=52.05 GHRR01008970.1:76-639(+)
MLQARQASQYACSTSRPAVSTQRSLRQQRVKADSGRALCRQATDSDAGPAYLAEGKGAVAVLLAIATSSMVFPDGASALSNHQEPSNALSLPTWAIHVSSVTEWIAAMALMWRYAEVSGNPRWKGMTWGMMPALGSAMAACTWHFFYNSPDLDFLVSLQALLTVVGNFTCWIAAYRIFAAAQAETSA